jgi:hypothetical protein
LILTEPADVAIDPRGDVMFQSWSVTVLVTHEQALDDWHFLRARAQSLDDVFVELAVALRRRVSDRFPRGISVLRPFTDRILNFSYAAMLSGQKRLQSGSGSSSSVRV